MRAENAEHGDLLFVGVPESYETIFAKVVAAWRWAVATHEFTFFMHADDDSYVRLDLLLEEGGIYLDADAFALAPLGDLRHFDFSAAHEEFQGVNKVNTG